jgi:hypothetical protein
LSFLPLLFNLRAERDQMQSPFGQPIYKLIEVIAFDDHGNGRPNGCDLIMVILDSARIKYE